MKKFLKLFSQRERENKLRASTELISLKIDFEFNKKVLKR